MAVALRWTARGWRQETGLDRRRSLAALGQGATCAATTCTRLLLAYVRCLLGKVEGAARAHKQAQWCLSPRRTPSRQWSPM